MKKVISVLLALVISSPASAAIIASFEADSSIAVETTFASSIEFIFDDTNIDEFWLDSDATGDGNVNTDTTNSGATLGVGVDGNIDGLAGSSNAEHGIAGILEIINDTGATVDVGNISFTLNLLAEIFTDTMAEYADAYSYVEIFDVNGNEIAFFEFELFSDVDGTGTVSSGLVDEVINFGVLNLAADGILEFEFVIDTFGTALASRQPPNTIPEPSTLLLIMLALTIATFRAKVIKEKTE